MRRIGEERARRQVGQHLALRQRDDALRVGGHQVHVVLDQNDGFHAGGLGGADQRFHQGRASRRWRRPTSARRAGSPRGSARRRKQRRAASSRPARACARCSQPRLDRPKMPAISAHAVRTLRHRRRGPSKQPPLLVLLGHDRGGDGLGNGQLRKDLHQLKRARHAALGQCDRPDAGDALSLEVDLRPLVGTSRPVSRLTSVVLPAPFGPTTLTNSPSPTASDTSCKRAETRRSVLTHPWFR